MRFVRRLLKASLYASLAAFLSLAGYGLASLAAERWSHGEPRFVSTQPKDQTIRLVTGLLHADIALEVTPDLLERFAFLRETDLPLDHPNLRYLAFGWGSKAFYTTAGTYSDIQVSAVFTAVTGDNSVMRITAFGPLKDVEDIIKLKLSSDQLDRVMTKIKESFARNGSGSKQYMKGVSIGPNDAFYKAKGHFNVFHPCNQWVNAVLHHAGVPIGVWTPTTFNLRRSLDYFGALQP